MRSDLWTSMWVTWIFLIQNHNVSKKEQTKRWFSRGIHSRETVSTGYVANGALSVGRIARSLYAVSIIEKRRKQPYAVFSNFLLHRITIRSNVNIFDLFSIFTSLTFTKLPHIQAEPRPKQPQYVFPRHSLRLAVSW
jgi:hypothetical protein